MKKYIMDICEAIGGIAMFVALCTTEYINELHAWLGISVALILIFCLAVKFISFIIETLKKRKERS